MASGSPMDRYTTNVNAVKLTMCAALAGAVNGENAASSGEAALRAGMGLGLETGKLHYIEGVFRPTGQRAADIRP